jgi:hypothetical protein
MKPLPLHWSIRSGQEDQLELHVVVNIVNSPITVQIGAHEPPRWIERMAHLFESTAIRIAICIISLSTLVWFVGRELGYRHGETHSVRSAPLEDCCSPNGSTPLPQSERPSSEPDRQFDPQPPVRASERGTRRI